MKFSMLIVQGNVSNLDVISYPTGVRGSVGRINIEADLICC